MILSLKPVKKHIRSTTPLETCILLTVRSALPFKTFILLTNALWHIPDIANICYNDRILYRKPREPQKQMSYETEKLIEELDRYFAREDLAGAGAFLEAQREQACLSGDWQRELTLANEQLGFYRRVNREGAAMEAVERAIRLIEDHKELAEVTVGTVCLNAATTLKAFGRQDRAMPLYSRALHAYEQSLSPGDYRFAGLYNNMAGAYQDAGEFDRAEHCYQKAIHILSGLKDREPDIAVTYVNLAQLYFAVDELSPAVYDCMENAQRYLDLQGVPRDENYAYSCRKCAPVFDFFGYFSYKKELTERADRIYAGN